MFFYVGFVLAERVLYTPSVGYCLLLGYGYGALERRFGTKWPRMGLAVVLTVYGMRTVIRNQDWQDDESLYRSGVHVNPPKGQCTAFGFFFKFSFIIVIRNGLELLKPADSRTPDASTCGAFELFTVFINTDLICVSIIVKRIVILSLPSCTNSIVIDMENTLFVTI